MGDVDLMSAYDSLEAAGPAQLQQEQQQQQEPQPPQPPQQQQQQPPQQPAGLPKQQQAAGRQAKQQQQQQPKKQPKKQRKLDPAREVAGRLHQACKAQRSREVLALFEQARAAGLTFQQAIYNTVLYQAAGGEAWERLARRAAGQAPAEPAPAPAPPAQEGPEGAAAAPEAGEAGPEAAPLMSAEDVEFVTSKAGGIFDAMQAQRWRLDEVGYTAMARVALLRGGAQQAMEWALRARAAGLPVRLRSYHPALVGYALRGDADGAMRVSAGGGACCCVSLLRVAAAAVHPAYQPASHTPRHHHTHTNTTPTPHPAPRQVLDIYSEAGLDLTELELRYMLEAVARGGSYGQFSRLAALLADNLNALEPATAAHVAAFFAGGGAAAAAQQAVAQAAAEAEQRQQQEASHGNLQQQEEQQQQQQPEAQGEQQPEQQQEEPAPSGGSSGSAAAQYSGWEVLQQVEVQQDGSCPAAGGRLRVVELQDEE